jgi:CRISPR/Cas system Type II protein with McrA/HNH and RuvC-like nuclease domain
MNEERKKILEMLAEGKINADEAERLISALESAGVTDSGELRSATGTPLRYLRVLVEPGKDSENHEKVNIRVPLKLIRAGLKLTSFIPKDAQHKVNQALQEQGINADFTNLKPDDLEEIVHQLNDLSIDVEGKETVRVYCE